MTEEEKPVSADQEIIASDSNQTIEEKADAEEARHQNQLALSESEAMPETATISEAESAETEVVPVGENLEADMPESLNEPSEPIVPAETPAGIDAEFTPAEPIAEPLEASAPETKIAPPAIEERMSLSTIFGIIFVLLVILALIYFVTRKPADVSADEDGQKVTVSDSVEQGKVSIIEETKNDINVLVNYSDETVYPKIKVTAYLGNTQKNPQSADCSLTYPLEREIDKKYDSNMINTMIGLLEPLSATEKELGYVSVIPAGTVLKYLKLDDSGVMSVNLSGNISKAAGSCAVTAIRSQVRDTISQFAAVKSVVICIDGNCRDDQILQP